MSVRFRHSLLAVLSALVASPEAPPLSAGAADPSACDIRDDSMLNSDSLAVRKSRSDAARFNMACSAVFTRNRSSARRLSSINSVAILYFSTTFRGGSGGRMTPAYCLASDCRSQ